MRIRDISLQEVVSGKNWGILSEDTSFWLGEGVSGHSLEGLRVVAKEDFSEDDYIVYSGLVVGDSGRVQPILLARRIGDRDYGGAYCVRINGKWCHLGQQEDSGFEPGLECIANPLKIDKSFDSEDDTFRVENGNDFRLHAQQLLK